MSQAQSTPVTATGTVQTGPGVLFGAHLAAAAANSTAVLYDGTSTSGTIIAKLAALANAADDLSPSAPITFRVGLHVVMAGASAHLNVFL